MQLFDPKELKKLYIPAHDSNGEDNGQVTIIGGSSLFHGAPLLSLKVASRTVDMVFFASPEPSIGEVSGKLKSKLLSFIWVPWEDVEDYIAKSDAVLIGPGFMRFSSEKTDSDLRHTECDDVCRRTGEITHNLLGKFPDKKWVIDAGSLQVMEAERIPKGAIVTPNKKEFEMLFKVKTQKSNIKMKDKNVKMVKEKAEEHNCTIVLKGPETIVSSPDETVVVKGGNPGMTKGGTGDVLAGLTVALLAKNDPLLAAASASYIEKYAADELFNKVGTNYNADDLADIIPQTFSKLLQ
jgi:hydroxyethylthiazole kinase-like uncharacterized protein yjeF